MTVDQDGDDEPPLPILHEEALRLREHVETLLETAGDNRRKIETLIESLNDAMSGDDIDRLQAVLDEVTDVLIDLELQED
jgi:Mn-dependent DtxR family transcriptional regulator